MADTPNKIEEIRKALEGATPGPWTTHVVDDTAIVAANGVDVGTTCDSAKAEREDAYNNEYERMEADARFIALAPDMARIVLAAEKMAQAMPRWIVAMADWNAGGEAALIEMETLLDEYRAAVEGGE